MPTNKTIREQFEERFTDQDDGTFSIGLDKRYATKDDFLSFLHTTLLNQLSEIEDMVDSVEVTGKRKYDDDDTPEKAKLCQDIYDRMIKPKLLQALKEKKDNLKDK